MSQPIPIAEIGTNKEHPLPDGTEGYPGKRGWMIWTEAAEKKYGIPRLEHLHHVGSVKIYRETRTVQGQLCRRRRFILESQCPSIQKYIRLVEKARELHAQAKHLGGETIAELAVRLVKIDGGRPHDGDFRERVKRKNASYGIGLMGVPASGRW